MNRKILILSLFLFAISSSVIFANAQKSLKLNDSDIFLSQSDRGDYYSRNSSPNNGSFMDRVRGRINESYNNSNSNRQEWNRQNNKYDNSRDGYNRNSYDNNKNYSGNYGR